MFTNETELHHAREIGNMSEVYCQLVILGRFQLASILSARRVSRAYTPDDRTEVVHDAATSLIERLIGHPERKVLVWHQQMRWSLGKTLNKRRSQTVELNDDSTWRYNVETTDAD